MSGYWVELWLPQIVIFLMSVVCAPVFSASCDMARLWSRRTIAVKHFGSRSGAFCCAISALVLAGLPTTSTFTLRLACSFIALPCGPKIAPFASSRSLRSMPGRADGRRPAARSRHP